MSKSFKKIIIGIFVIAIVLVVGFFAARYYAYHGGKRDVQSEKTAFVLKTKDIVSEFTSSETTANAKYLEKPVALTGVVTSVNDKEVILDEIGVCNFLNQDPSIKVGQTITIKGRVIGYDDILGGINLDQCSTNK